MSKAASFAQAQQARGAVLQWLADYIRVRDQAWWCGEFLDEEGRTNKQCGLSGTAFISFIERHAQMKPQKFHEVFSKIQELTERGNSIESEFSAVEIKLMKDVPRVTTKAILLSLGPDEELKSKEVIHKILTKVGDNGLIKPIMDDPQANGDAISTAIIVLIIIIAGKSKFHMTEIYAVIPHLRRELNQGQLEIYEKLLVSTVLCELDFANSINEHRRFISELYASDKDWHRAFSSNSPFIDHRFADRTSKGGERDRYVRVPLGFIVLVAIFMSIGNENEFFDFPPVRRLIADIKTPFSAHVGRDRNKASVYYAWYAYIALHPGSFFKPPVQPKWRISLSRAAYWINDLTMVGVIVVIFLIAGVLALVWFLCIAVQSGLRDQIDKLIGAAGTACGSLLGLFKTRKR